jgi:Uncharacterized protein conserved in bacteria (DUF2330)
MRSGNGVAVFACVAGFHLAHATAAFACGAVAAKGSYVRLASEKTVIVWDAENKTEHFLRKTVFEGDPKDFGFLVPTPIVPEVAKVDARLFAEMEALLPAPVAATASAGVGGGAGRAGAAIVVEQTVRLGDFELVSLRAGDARALVDWLGANGYATRASLEMWAQRYVARGWVLNAMRYAPAPESAAPVARTIEAPAVRLSFAIETPFYPYTEAPPDAREEQAFVARSKVSPRARPLDLWVVAAGEVEAREGEAAVGTGDTPGPLRVGVASVPSWRLEAALVGSAPWLRVRARDSWTITRFREDALQRTAWDDLTFEAPRGADRGRDDPSPDASRAIALAIVAAAIALGLVLALTDRSRPGR